MTSFIPTSITDLADRVEQERFLAALKRVRDGLGQTYGLHLSGHEVMREDHLVSTNPSRPDEVIGRVAVATAEDISSAVLAADEAFCTWRQTTPEQRMTVLLRAAELMRGHRAELSALVLLETGKSWAEADGEVAESVDFLEYHAREYTRLLERARTCLSPHPRERNSYHYLPLGAGVALPPWPFPIAQLVGMVSAAVVTGNAVIVKPASLAPVTSRTVLRLFLEAGMPPGVVSMLFGPGGEVGQALARHPRTRFVSFTGSKTAGRAVFITASELGPTQRWFKRIVLEMAGKNAVIVDETADLDAAATGIVSGAFSFQGQKCSAGSRVIVVREAHDALVERVVAAAERLVVGDPCDFATDLGPMIDESAVNRVLEYIDVGRFEGRLVTGGRCAEAGQSYLLPTIFIDVAPTARIAREEILGPVLAVIAARDVTEAFSIANDTEYGLTGSYYSTSEARLARARHTFHVGSLYLNRKPTASEVGFHPFGGFNMSGTDAKAGGPDYLLNYVQAKTISEC